jgi:DNA-binding transcriptional LysR family regulator
MRYLPIAEHGLIGDLHTVALVGTDATIDWYCCPRFDSPSVFASILDADRRHGLGRERAAVGGRALPRLARTHPLAARQRLALKDLAEETWIEGAHPDCLGPLEELGRLIGAEPRIGFHCEDWTGKQALAAAGVGIMLVPSVAAGTLRDDIIVRRLPRTFPPREIYAAVTRGSRAPAVDEMLACLREVAESRPTIDPLP